MSLYMSPAFFFCLLARCFYGGTHPTAAVAKADSSFSFITLIWRVAQLGVVVIGTFALHWVPFCLYAAPEEGCLPGLGQVLHRMFPFQRGLFEDKVANIWCSLSLLIKVNVVGAPAGRKTATEYVYIYMLSYECKNMSVCVLVPVVVAV